MSFGTDTAVKRVGDRCFVAELDERWSSLVGIHGGYSAAVVVRAMEQAVNDPDRAFARSPPSSPRRRARDPSKSK